MDRRLFAKMAALAPVALALAGCHPQFRQFSNLRDTGSVEWPLLIDTHAHIFNGTDLQVREFLFRVAAEDQSSSAIRTLVRLLAPALQRIAWGLAPSASKELRRFEDYGRGRSSLIADEQIAQSEQDMYRIGRAEIERAANEAIQASAQPERFSNPRESLTGADFALASLRELPDNYEALHDPARDAMLEAGTGFAGIGPGIRFLVEMFQYRHVSALHYFKTYRGDNLEVDLLTPSLVDYDWWLAGGRSTDSSLASQVDVNERIAAVSGGKIHPFIAFDPFRQVMWDKHGVGDRSPLDIVKESMNRGFIGVKMYPPMGFAMHDNARFADRSATIWGDKDWLNDVAKSPGFGAELDAALDGLYDYCAGAGVPIMAHSMRSNMAHVDYEPLLFADSWASMYAHHDVSASYGHFSGLGSDRAEDEWRDFVALLTQETGSQPPKRYADVSYFNEVLKRDNDVSGRLKDILFDAAGDPTNVERQLLFGSDWKMLLLEPGSKRYLTAILEALRQADAQLESLGFETDLQTRVMGLNAANHLGLNAGSGTRSRLEAFYGRWQIPTPLWMQKVDAQTT